MPNQNSSGTNRPSTNAPKKDEDKSGQGQKQSGGKPDSTQRTGQQGNTGSR